MQLDLNQIKELLASLNDTDISELQLKGENFELSVRRGSDQEIVVAPAAMAPVAQVPTMQPQAYAPPQPAAAPAAPAATPPGNPNWVEIKSPMVGTFYEAPAPGESAFVKVGDRIKAGQTVCILEAMKLMNELEAEVTGEIVEILVENGQPVEFDQPLMRVLP